MSYTTLTMLTTLRNRYRQFDIAAGLIAVAVVAVAFLLGQRASLLWLARLCAVLAGVALLTRPVLGMLALVPIALLLRWQINTGTEVSLNFAALLIPVMGGIWLLDMVRRRKVHFVSSPVNRPLLLFLVASLFSLLIARATWSPFVPVSNGFLVVQLAQWAIFAFSALAFWLTANLVADEKTLWRLTTVFLLLAGSVAILRAVPGMRSDVEKVTTIAIVRAPFWMLLVAFTGGQLLWNRRLSLAWRLFLIAALLAALVYAFVEQQETTSNWMGLSAALVTLAWLRFSRLRWLLLVLIMVLVLSNALFPALYDFAGGDAEWEESGGSRLVLIERVVDVTLRNPITGLGPAGYRPYANATPLRYEGANWLAPRVSSHNNYVDLFAHGGIVALVLFGWFVGEMVRLGVRLRARYTDGFAAGYVNSVLAAGVGSLILMFFADWILPFVYNIGFPGFQASVLVWLFLGGLVALENMPQPVNGDP